MTILLRSMKAEDCDMVYAWQSQPGRRRYSRNPAIPSYEEHCQWMAKTLENSDRNSFIVEYEGKAAGLLRADHRGSGIYEVSILIDEGFEGKGIARAALAAMEAKFKGVTFHAEIFDENVKSIQLFTKSGYTYQSERLYIKRIP